MTVPVTNAAITKAMSVGGKLLDTRLCHTSGMLVKALVPIARCISNIGQKTGKPITSYLNDLNESSTFDFCSELNQLRKEVARIHISDSALAELCKWECEVGQEDLFPFDVVKKCEDILKARRLGKPAFRPYRYGRTRKFAPRQGTRKPHYQSRERNSQRPFFFRPQGVPWEGDAGLQSSPVTPHPVGNKVLSLLNTAENFVGGKIHASNHLWQALSTDKWIHAVVNDYVLEFDCLPIQRVIPTPLRLSETDQNSLDNALLAFMKYFQFTCLPQGMMSAPCIFTKLLKPALSHLRKLGITMLGYLDDCLFLATSKEELEANVRYALNFLTLWGSQLMLINLSWFLVMRWNSWGLF
uniref:Reverse transcriptase domain-containing protein n=1 Tax=Scylla olivacea TaxID=85551 RepID=A0A0P4WG63_SCYOL